MAEAEEITGFALPEKFCGYTPKTIRVMNDELIEVLYRDDITGYELLIRKKAGEDEDISGDYNSYEFEETAGLESGGTITHKWGKEVIGSTLISHNGFSYSIYTEDGYAGDEFVDVLDALTSEDPVEEPSDKGQINTPANNTHAASAGNDATGGK